MSTLSEYQRRRFLATEALALGRRGVDKVSQFVGASKNTLYNGIKEIKADYTPDNGRIRRSGGGSNSSSHHIVKQDLMDLASRLDMNLLVMHHPPYCSKFNPIGHKLFSQISRSWSGAPLLSVENAAERAFLWDNHYKLLHPVLDRLACACTLVLAVCTVESV
ncbi:MAG: hypothetical protein MJY68_07410 [Bacteroidaceae bacterium]|nr:hypothetical protein [Bacteroidaceae bacterium]